MKTDRELLEQAAKAACYKLAERGRKDGLFVVLTNEDGDYIWNPLTNDGDALRLAIDLNIDLCKPPVGNAAAWDQPDRYAATRRAVVTAAAALAV